MATFGRALVWGLLLLLSSGSAAWSQRLRIMACNLTSGSGQAYEAPGIRILQGVKPDIVLVQEFNYGTNSGADLRTFVDSVCGPASHFFREPVGGIPNGIISRYPILQSGEWDDPRLTDRDFVWVRIDVPGPRDLWAVSIHLKAGSGFVADRTTQCTNLKNFIIAQNIPASDYLVIGGDLNIYAHDEPLFAQLSAVVNVTGPFPADAAGDADTNAGRNSPYDGVYADGDLTAIQVPVVIGGQSFANGLVVDTRSYAPIADLAPALAADSGATGMQHMGVVRDFLLPLPPDPAVLPLLAANFHFSNPPSLTMTFSATVGAPYEVRVSTTMAGGSWTLLGAITATNLTQTISVVTTQPTASQVRDPSLGTGARRFYRIVRL